MFTGIIQAVGKLAQVSGDQGTRRFEIDASALVQRIGVGRFALGESIAVNGACLTIVAFESGHFTADVSAETLRCTNLGQLRPQDPVNLEAALRVGDALGGHWVLGHVDGCAMVQQLVTESANTQATLQAPDDLAPFIAAKGSVTLDGVSLTVNQVRDTVFTVNLIPHTVAVTALGRWKPGQMINLEVDALARYAQRLLLQSQP